MEKNNHSFFFKMIALQIPCPNILTNLFQTTSLVQKMEHAKHYQHIDVINVRHAFNMTIIHSLSKDHRWPCPLSTKWKKTMVHVILANLLNKKYSFANICKSPACPSHISQLLIFPFLKSYKHKWTWKNQNLSQLKGSKKM
jgi:hypothetical protein